MRRIQPGVPFSAVSRSVRIESLRCLMGVMAAIAWVTIWGGSAMHSSDMPLIERSSIGVTAGVCVRLYMAARMARKATGPHCFPPAGVSISCGMSERPHQPGASMYILLRFGRVVRCARWSDWRSLENSNSRWAIQMGIPSIVTSLLARITSGVERPEGSAARRRYSS